MPGSTRPRRTPLSSTKATAGLRVYCFLRVLFAFAARARRQSLPVDGPPYPTASGHLAHAGLVHSMIWSNLGRQRGTASADALDSHCCCPNERLHPRGVCPNACARPRSRLSVTHRAQIEASASPVLDFYPRGNGSLTLLPSVTPTSMAESWVPASTHWVRLCGIS